MIQACVDSCFHPLMPQINNSPSGFGLGKMFQVVLSSFSHLTFGAADIILEKIFCKSMKAALFINPLFSIRPHFSPITSNHSGTPSFCSYLAKSCPTSLKLFVHRKPRSVLVKERPTSKEMKDITTVFLIIFITKDLILSI